MEYLVIYAPIIGTISIICFFKLCFDIAKIKSHLLQSKNDLLNDIEKSLAFGDIEIARENLKSLIWKEILHIQKEFSNGSSARDKEYIAIANKYKRYLEKLDLKFPDIENLS